MAAIEGEGDLAAIEGEGELATGEGALKEGELRERERELIKAFC